MSGELSPLIFCALSNPLSRVPRQLSRSESLTKPRPLGEVAPLGDGEGFNDESKFKGQISKSLTTSKYCAIMKLPNKTEYFLRSHCGMSVCIFIYTWIKMQMLFFCIHFSVLVGNVKRFCLTTIGADVFFVRWLRLAHFLF